MVDISVTLQLIGPKMIELEHLVEHLRAGNLVAFVGAGASRSYTDDESGKTWNGLPTASMLVERLAEKRSYIDKSMAFDEACFLYKHNNGRSDLEAFLVEHIDRPVIKPLPADVLLANLSFSAYITTNYDTLLERALVQERKKPHVVITDSDVSRIRQQNTPIMKIHGCVTRPQTMIASSDEFLPIGERLPIVEALLRTYLANKVVLFLGFSLEDKDFSRIFEDTKQILGAYMPKSYAVVQDMTEFRDKYWQAKGVHIIKGDLTDFLRQLLRASASGTKSSVYHPGEDWINNAFFESLHKIRTLPSETQVVDAFLSHLVEEMRSPSFQLEDVLARASKATSLVLEQRPNYHALENLANDLLNRIHETTKTKEEAESMITQVIHQREGVGRRIADKAIGLVLRGESILLYSQSIRVLQLLSGVPRGIQDTCQVYIAECRPKSPLPFQDALSTCEHIIGMGYEVTMIPDVAVGNLMMRHQINRVFMGAHEVFMREGKPIAFVNTCGSWLVLRAAQDNGIPVYVIAEQNKLINTPTSEELPIVSYQEEEALFESTESSISNFRASGLRMSALNIGYDLCLFSENEKLISD